MMMMMMSRREMAWGLVCGSGDEGRMNTMVVDKK
jgi:hypothetical protein